MINTITRLLTLVSFNVLSSRQTKLIRYSYCMNIKTEIHAGMGYDYDFALEAMPQDIQIAW